MRTALLAILLLAALPAAAQGGASAASSPLPTLDNAGQARVDAAMIEGIELLLAGKRAAARAPLQTALDRAVPPADRSAIEAGDRVAAHARWIASRRLALDARDWAQGARWNQLIAVDKLASTARDEAASVYPNSADTYDDVWFLVYTLAMAGETQRATAFARPFIAAADPQFEVALAKDLAERAQSVDAWGKTETPKGAALIALGLALFDCADGRAPDAVRLLHNSLAEIRRRSGDIAGARIAYARARKPGEPLRDVEIALMFEAGETDTGLRAVRQVLGEPPDAPLSRAAADKLIALTAYTGGSSAATIALHRLALASYRRALTLGDKPLENAISVLAGALVDAGDPAQAEPLLAELFGYYERRHGFDTAGANQYALRLAQAIAAQARYDEADLLYRRLWTLVEKYQAHGDPDAQRYAQGIAEILLARGQIDGALAFNTDALGKARRAKDADQAVLASFLTMQARLLALGGQLDQAEAAAREAIALGPSDDKLTIAAMFDNPAALARAHLASLLEARGKADQAEPIRRLLLRKIEESEMLPWEGELRRAAILTLAANLTQQDKAEGRRLFAERLALNAGIFGADSPQLLDVAEPFARALLRAGRAGAALAPARAALAARTSSRFVGDAGGVTLADRALSLRRREAARLLVQAAWRAGKSR